MVIGVPLYSNAAGIMPMVQALYEKGLPISTLLAFMMSVVAAGILAVGYLFNAVLA